MPVNIERRRLIIGGSLGMGALLLPAGRLLASELLGARGFTHSVASGEPASDSMLFWTRFVPPTDTDTIKLEVQVAKDPDFHSIVGGDVVRTGAYRDWTAKVTVDALEAGRQYWYRFLAPGGLISPIGRTKTLPEGRPKRFGLGVFSCSNLPTGWFNAYAHASFREDMDLWLHVGDYVYEYALSSYAIGDRVNDREVLPAHDHEMISLADYRMRYACYRADPDLQRLHRVAPMVGLWDDHESANDSWEGGAQNHQPIEGDWIVRKAAAMQAYAEWMPVSEEPWKVYRIGQLATLYRTESRLTARTRPAYAELARAHASTDPDAALRAFRDGDWKDPSATMLGTQQETWLSHQLRENAKHGGWQLVGMGTIIGRTLMPEQTLGWLKPERGAKALEKFSRDVRGSKLGIPMWMDRWDGYPAARSRLLNAALAADADLVMLSGDSHNAWAYSLVQNGHAAGVEFAGHAVTSNGIETALSATPQDVARAFVQTNPELKWADTSHRGYMMVEITAEEASCEWNFLQTVKRRTLETERPHRMSVVKGRRQLV